MNKSKAVFYARRFLAGEPIPLFTMKADNRQIDAMVDEIVAARRAHIWRSRRSRVSDGYKDFVRGGNVEEL